MHSKQEIISAFQDAAVKLQDYINLQPGERFEETPGGKWSAGQHLDHMIRAVKPLNLAFRLPGPALGLLFGKSNRAGRNYEQLVERYKAKLDAGGVASGAFVPPPVRVSEKARLLAEFSRRNQKLVKTIARKNEADLDKYILPHPLLGKVTLREMMFFTIYHNQHHLKILKDRDQHVSA